MGHRPSKERKEGKNMIGVIALLAVGFFVMLMGYNYDNASWDYPDQPRFVWYLIALWRSMVWQPLKYIGIPVGIILLICKMCGCFD